MTHSELEALIDSFDGSARDVDRIRAHPVRDASQFWRLLEGVESADEGLALVETNPRWAAEVAESKAAYDNLVNGPDFAAIAAAADPAPLIATLTPTERAAFVQHVADFPPDATEAEVAAVYLQAVLDE